MKKVYLMFLLCLSVIASVSAQAPTPGSVLPVDAGTHKVTYLEVVDATGVTAANLYKLTKEWAVKQGLTIKEDVANEKLVFDGVNLMDYPNVGANGQDKGKVKYTYSVFFKDGKARYIMTDFVHENADPKAAANGGRLELVSAECGSSKMSAKGWQTIKAKTGTHAKTLTDDYKRVIKEYQNNPANKTDW